MTNLLYKPLLGMVLSIWSTLAGQSKGIIPSVEACSSSLKNEICACADGAVRAVLDEDDDVAPVYTSRDEDLAVMASFIYRESSMQLRAVGDGGRSFGMLQMRNREARGDAYAQASAWLRLLHAAAVDERFGCPEHPAAAMWGSCKGIVPDGKGGTAPVSKLASKREWAARKLLMQAMRIGPDEKP